jgi:hypothetical protein
MRPAEVESSDGTVYHGRKTGLQLDGTNRSMRLAKQRQRTIFAVLRGAADWVNDPELALQAPG